MYKMSFRIHEAPAAVSLHHILINNTAKKEVRPSEQVVVEPSVQVVVEPSIVEPEVKAEENKTHHVVMYEPGPTEESKDVVLRIRRNKK